jgi:hypothetical protein
MPNYLWSHRPYSVSDFLNGAIGIDYMPIASIFGVVLKQCKYFFDTSLHFHFLIPFFSKTTTRYRQMIWQGQKYYSVGPWKTYFRIPTPVVVKSLASVLQDIATTFAAEKAMPE